MGYKSHSNLPALLRTVVAVAALCGCGLTALTRAQEQLPEDPEDEKQLGLWLDQGVSNGLSANKSLEVEFHERFNEGASNLFEYFVQAGVAFRPRTWLTLIPNYRYQRYPGNASITYENRLLFNTTLSASKGPWRCQLRTLVEGRFPDDRSGSARLRLRPGVEYTLTRRATWGPVIGSNNEFFLVPWTNPFANGGTSFTQDRFQAGVRLPVTASYSVRFYYMLQFVNLPAGWDENEIVGISMAYKVSRKAK